jgi:hypothetical protein
VFALKSLNVTLQRNRTYAWMEVEEASRAYTKPIGDVSSVTDGSGKTKYPHG